jgi:hypothetical protein
MVLDRLHLRLDLAGGVALVLQKPELTLRLVPGQKVILVLEEEEDRVPRRDTVDLQFIPFDVLVDPGRIDPVGPEQFKGVCLERRPFQAMSQPRDESWDSTTKAGFR